MILEFLMDKPLLSRGIVHHHPIKFVHAMTIGASGVGKSHLNKLCISMTALQNPSSQITILDFKADDYHFARGLGGRLFEFEEVKAGLENYYNMFLERQRGRCSDRSYRLLVIEELGAMLGYFGKKEAEEIKSIIGNLVFLGRSFACHTLISTQRPDSSNYNPGVRDSTNCIIALGNLSKEGKAMMFSGFQDEMTEKHGVGSGYMLIDSAKLYSISVPKITKLQKLEHYIKLGITRGI